MPGFFFKLNYYFSHVKISKQNLKYLYKRSDGGLCATGCLKNVDMIIFAINELFLTS